MISYISFNINFPHACTMDFRYIVITVIVGAIYIGLFCRQIERRDNVAYKIGLGFIYSATIIYGISSILVYLTVK